MILVTGATGHVGNVLVHDLAQSGEELRLFLQPTESVGSLSGIAFQLICGDIRDRETVMKACEGVDYVYHLAGLIDIAPKDGELMNEVNVIGTRNIVEACLANGVKRLVFTSSIHALPEQPIGTAFREVGADAFPRTDLLGAYARSKSAATAEVYKGIEKGLDAVMLFPTGIIGPGDYRGSEMGRVVRYLMGKSRSHLLPCFKGAYDFVDVRDVSSALIAAMRQGRKGEGYLIAGHRLSIPDLYRNVLKNVGRHSIRLVMFPLWLVRFASSIVLKWAHLLNRKPFFTPYSIDVLMSNSEVDASKAARELNFKPRDMDDTLRETVSWFDRLKAYGRLHGGRLLSYSRRQRKELRRIQQEERPSAVSADAAKAPAPSMDKPR